MFVQNGTPGMVDTYLWPHHRFGLCSEVILQVGGNEGQQFPVDNVVNNFSQISPCDFWPFEARAVVWQFGQFKATLSIWSQWLRSPGNRFEHWKSQNTIFVCTSPLKPFKQCKLHCDRIE